MSVAAWQLGAPRALPARRRADLEIRPSPAGVSTWLVKDPAALRYYELGSEEYFILRQLDGRTSWDEIRARFDQTFAPQRLDAERLERFTAQLYRQGLLIADTAGQGAKLLERGDRLRRQERRRRFANPLAIRLPGVDPEPLLARLTPACGWMFTRWFAAAYVLLLGTAIVAAILNSDALLRAAAIADALLAPDNLPLLLTAVVGAKVLHELGHAVACRRLGGECREIGVLLLVGLPCLYCDVTSVWMVPERRKRLIVGAAGMLVELALAAAALLLWQASAPGMFHALCLNLAVVCSVGTVLVNANPLLRYDGYFILTDLVGTTNLGERADTALRRRVSRWFLGDAATDDRLTAESRGAGLALFAAASLTYRWLLTIGILWFVRQLLKPYGLTPLADLLAVVVVASMTVPPATRLVRGVRAAVRDRRIDRRRFTLRGGIVVLLAAALMFWPLPYHVAAPSVVGLHQARYLYVTTPGRLVEAAELGSHVATGGSAVQFENLELRRQVVALTGETAALRAAIDKLELRLRDASDRTREQAIAAELEAARKKLPALEELLRLREAEAARLTLLAPIDGVVLPLPAALAPETSPADANAADSHDESPLAPRLRGKFWEAGTPLCAIGDPRNLEAVAAVDQHDIEWVLVGSRVRLQFDAAGGDTVDGLVIERAASPMSDPPPELVAAGRLAVRLEAGRVAPTVPHYLVRIKLDAATPTLPPGTIGRAKIAAAPQSLARRGVRWLAGTFRFQAD